jgi:hypothetical protein
VPARYAPVRTLGLVRDAFIESRDLDWARQTPLNAADDHVQLRSAPPGEKGLADRPTHRGRGCNSARTIFRPSLSGAYTPQAVSFAVLRSVEATCTRVSGGAMNRDRLPEQAKRVRQAAANPLTVSAGLPQACGLFRVPRGYLERRFLHGAKQVARAHTGTTSRPSIADGPLHA